MAVELQVREATIAQALIEWTQTRLYTLCVPTNTPAGSVDHLDTLPGSVTFSKGAKGSIDAHLSIAVYIVTEPDLLAHPNATPAGATVPAGQIGLLFELGIVNQALTLVKARSQPTAPGVPTPIRDQIKLRVDKMLESLDGTVIFDCAPIVAALEAEVPAEPDLGRGGGVLALRFGSTGATISQLGPNQAWGVFLDADDMVALLKRRIPKNLPAPVNVHWQADGPTPVIVATTGIDLSVLGIDVASVSANIEVGPKFVPPSTLRLAATWNVDLGGILSPFRPAARKYIRGEIRRRLTTATHDGPQSFYYEFALPPIPSFLGAQPVWAEITSNPAGVTVGGPVTPSPAGERGTFRPTVFKFGRPTWWGHCRALAKGGDGKPPKHFEANGAGVRVQAGVNFADPGALCGTEVLPPNTQRLSGWMSSNADGVGFDLSVGAARKITDAVHIIVRTARGIRFIDLGKPIIRQAEDGRGLDVQVNYIPDCLFLSGAVLKLALGEALTADDFRPPPLEDPSWREWFYAERGMLAHFLPGTDGDGAVALATLASGRTVVVEDDSPAPRVSGEYVGPPVGMQTDGQFAIGRSADSVHLFGLRRARDVNPRPPAQ